MVAVARLFGVMTNPYDKDRVERFNAFRQADACRRLLEDDEIQKIFISQNKQVQSNLCVPGILTKKILKRGDHQNNTEKSMPSSIALHKKRYDFAIRTVLLSALSSVPSFYLYGTCLRVSFLTGPHAVFCAMALFAAHFVVGGLINISLRQWCYQGQIDILEEFSYHLIGCSFVESSSEAKSQVVSAIQKKIEIYETGCSLIYSRSYFIGSIVVAIVDVLRKGSISFAVYYMLFTRLASFCISAGSLVFLSYANKINEKVQQQKLAMNSVMQNYPSLLAYGYLSYVTQGIDAFHNHLSGLSRFERELFYLSCQYLVVALLISAIAFGLGGFWSTAAYTAIGQEQLIQILVWLFGEIHSNASLRCYDGDTRSLVAMEKQVDEIIKENQLENSFHCIKFNEISIKKRDKESNLESRSTQEIFYDMLDSESAGYWTIEGNNGTGKSVLLRHVKALFNDTALWLPAHSQVVCSGTEINMTGLERSSGQVVMANIKHVLEKAKQSIEKQDSLIKMILLDEWRANLSQDNVTLFDEEFKKVAKDIKVIEIRHEHLS